MSASRAIYFAALVLQHIETDSSRAYLADFAKIAPAIYLLTRLQSDFGLNVLGLVAESGLFDAADCAEVEHDPQNNQLRHVGRRPFAQVAQATDNLHYEVVLIPKRSS